jgi:probable addiction module antidote protein
LDFTSWWGKQINPVNRYCFSKRIKEGVKMNKKNKLKPEDYKISRWDSANYLESQEEIEAYLESAFETDDPDHIARAVGIAIRAQGMLKTAKKSGLDRSGLYHSFSSSGGDPRLSTLTKVVNSLGYHLSLTPNAPRQTPKQATS